MSQLSPLESRIAALISAYADRAPVDFDARAVARLAASRATARGRWPWSMLGDSGLVFVVLVVILLVTLVAGALLVGGGPFHRTPEEMLTQPAIVAPFTGLPPDGAPASDPETGELVLSFYGRPRTIGLDFHRMWVYADGRLVWTRNLDGVTSPEQERAFGASQPTNAVIEQRLTPVGVELLRRKAMLAALKNLRPVAAGRATWGLPGVLWGGLTLRQGDRLLEADWTDGDLPGLLADPADWLPLVAWEDRRIAGYVPSRYAICVWPGDLAAVTERLPQRAQTLLRAAPLVSVEPEQGMPPGCRSVTAQGAREIVMELETDPRIQRERPDGLRYVIATPETFIDVLPILPNGEVVCECG